MKKITKTVSREVAYRGGAWYVKTPDPSRRRWGRVLPDEFELRDWALAPHQGYPIGYRCIRKTK